MERIISPSWTFGGKLFTSCYTNWNQSTKTAPSVISLFPFLGYRSTISGFADISFNWIVEFGSKRIFGCLWRRWHNADDAITGSSFVTVQQIRWTEHSISVLAAYPKTETLVWCFLRLVRVLVQLAVESWETANLLGGKVVLRGDHGESSAVFLWKAAEQLDFSLLIYFLLIVVLWNLWLAAADIVPRKFSHGPITAQASLSTTKPITACRVLRLRSTYARIEIADNKFDSCGDCCISLEPNMSATNRIETVEYGNSRVNVCCCISVRRPVGIQLAAPLPFLALVDPSLHWIMIMGCWVHLCLQEGVEFH